MSKFIDRVLFKIAGESYGSTPPAKVIATAAVKLKRLTPSYYGLAGKKIEFTSLEFNISVREGMTTSKVIEYASAVVKYQRHLEGWGIDSVSITIEGVPIIGRQSCSVQVGVDDE